MPSLKSIRKRITSVKSTQKITRAMKMVAGARLTKAQTRITELRPYAVKTQEVLARITREAIQSRSAASAEDEAQAVATEPTEEPQAPEVEAEAGEGMIKEAVAPAGRRVREWLDQQKDGAKAEKRVLLVVLTSDRGLCGAFNTNINKRAEREWRERTAAGQDVKLMIVGRKGRDYLTRRGAPILEYLPGVWEKLGFETAQLVGKKILEPLLQNQVDAIYLVYNEFKSAMSQLVVAERLLPVGQSAAAAPVEVDTKDDAKRTDEFIFEPNKDALLDQLIPMYLDISILRALYESQASELGARMTAMDAATKNAKEMILALTLQYNKARQASITKELMEIIGGSEALKE